MLKVDTKEKFVVVRLSEDIFSVNVAEALTTFVIKQLQQPVKNVIVDFQNVVSAEQQALTDLATAHSVAYNNATSFVICNVQSSITKSLETLELLDVLNITPTESEAWDIVQMEEIERDLFGDE